MYLSRLILNPRCRAVQRDLADCQSLHRTVMALFGQTEGDDARARLGVLHRLDLNPRDGRLDLLVQSTTPPDFTRLAADYLAQTSEPNPTSKPVADLYARLVAGQALRFRLLANPTRKIDTKSGPAGERRNGQRVPLRDDESRLAWLARKGEVGGFRLRQVMASPATNERGKVPAVQSATASQLRGRHPAPGGGTANLTLEPVLFEGILEVTDAAALRQALAQGIGPGKAYGCGLLSLAPA
ncbi:MAG: type I-E CRISPR-associated protein Cas6/Cse3/CasE [Chloroflexi bacterium]|nr:type I-E CRISPR-associated protein Cas6/Cse3/CasE [Chloroflexota bacterium]